MQALTKTISHLISRPLRKGLLAAVLLAGIPSLTQAAQTWGSCTPIEVMTFSNRIHVRCSATFGVNIRYVAMASTNTAEVARALSVAQSALIAGRTVNFWYESTATGGPIGCLTTDCRIMSAIGAN